LNENILLSQTMIVFFQILIGLLWLWFLFLNIKTIFSYIILSDKFDLLKDQKTSSLIKESFLITKKKNFIFIGLFMILFFCIFPIFLIWYYVSDKWVIVYIYSLTYFLLFWWIFEMFLISFYKRNIIQKTIWDDIILEEKKEIIIQENIW
jgi:hypothetical protein